MMIEPMPDFKIEISPNNAEPGRHNVTLALPAGHCPIVHLSTQQARTLANEIIKAVNKAEVRTNLQTTANNMRRNDVQQANGPQNEMDPLRKPRRPMLVHS